MSGDGSHLLDWQPASCADCGAKTEDEASTRCRPRSDETGEYWCAAGDRTDEQGRILLPTAESIERMDAWLAEQREPDDPRTPCAPPALLAAVLAIVSHARLDMGQEWRAQGDLEDQLVKAFGRVAVSREHRLSAADRPDFLLTGDAGVAGIVIELKGPRHRAPEVLRQLERYAEHPEVTAIILATARAMHMPAMVGARGVPVRVVNLSRAWL